MDSNHGPSAGSTGNAGASLLCGHARPITRGRPSHVEILIRSTPLHKICSYFGTYMAATRPATPSRPSQDRGQQQFFTEPRPTTPTDLHCIKPIYTDPVPHHQAVRLRQARSQYTLSSTSTRNDHDMHRSHNRLVWKECNSSSTSSARHDIDTCRHEGHLQVTHHRRHAAASPTLHRQGLHQRGHHHHHRQHTTATSSTRWTPSVL